jgi:gamma-D-glutamyl-L-lysine dipeptidyl-peptidase
MEGLICGNVYVPLRAAPSHKSEMLSQLLFGEKYETGETAGTWMKVTTLFDRYSGWVDSEHLQRIKDSDSARGLTLNRALRCYRPDGSKLVLEAGCEIFNPDYQGKTFRLGDQVFSTSESFCENHVVTNESLADTAMRFLNSPYMWGGRIPSGIDCSGLTQLVYKIHGTTLPRDSSKQSEEGHSVSFLEESEPGDLLFFDNDHGIISHVGIVISHGLVLHASGRVRLDRVDHQGIYRDDLKRYTHKLRMIKRIKV